MLTSVACARASSSGQSLELQVEQLRAAGCEEVFCEKQSGTTAQGKRMVVPYFSLQLSLAMMILIAIVPLSALFYFIDRHWYHRLLQASVIQGGEIEKKYAKALPEIQLGTAISAASPLRFSGWFWRSAFFFVKEEKFISEGLLRSDAKIEILYKSVMYGVGFTAALYAFVKGIQVLDQPPIYWIVVGAKALGHHIFRPS